MESNATPAALATMDRGTNAVARQPQVADMLQMVIERGLTSENVAAFAQLVQLHREEIALNAEKEFAAAFLRLQTELPVIQGARGIPDKHGTIKFVYANFEDIDAIVRPLALRHGFTYGFREESFENGRVVVVMDLTHSGGHTRPIRYSCRVGNGPPGSNESQADGSGHTYAQRGALEQGLALRILNKRPDAKMEGETITESEANELETRAKDCHSDIPAMLRLGGVTQFAALPRAKYDVLIGLLEIKERKKGN